MADLWIEREGRAEWATVATEDVGLARAMLHEDCLCLLEEREDLRGRVAELESGFIALRDFIASKDIGCFGSNWSPQCGEWSVRDEVIDNITQLLLHRTEVDK